MCLSCGKLIAKSEVAVRPFGVVSNISRGFGKACRALFLGEGFVWQIEQIAGFAPLKNCCLWQFRQDWCLGYSVMSGNASFSDRTFFQLSDGNL